MTYDNDVDYNSLIVNDGLDESDDSCSTIHTSKIDNYIYLKAGSKVKSLRSDNLVELVDDIILYTNENIRAMLNDVEVIIINQYKNSNILLDNHDKRFFIVKPKIYINGFPIQINEIVEIELYKNQQIFLHNVEILMINLNNNYNNIFIDKSYVIY
jgi:hypothetical protein